MCLPVVTRLPPDRFVAKKAKSGRYENASEVVRPALRALEREEREYETKLAELRAAY